MLQRIFLRGIIYAFKNLAKDRWLPRNPREMPTEITPPIELHGKKENAIGPKEALIKGPDFKRND